jgi:hypothetical protein
MDAAGNLNPGPITPRTLNVNYAKTPADNAVITAVSEAKVTFTWTAVPISPTMANMLKIEIDDNSDFSTPESVSSPLLASNVITYNLHYAIGASAW